jgi:hypothetical protein
MFETPYQRYRTYIADYMIKERLKTQCTKNDHIHHSGKTFKTIVEDFCFWNDISIYTELSPAQQRLFYLYHEQNCNLVKVTKQEHIEIHRFDYEQKGWMNKY